MMNPHKTLRPLSRYIPLLLLCITASILFASTLSLAQSNQSGVWRGNSRAGVYTTSPVRTTPSIAWQYKLPKGSLFAPPTLDGDTLYLISQDSVLRAININTRQEKWSHPTGGIDSGLVVDNGTLYYGSDKGLYALNTSTGVQKWAFTIEGRVIGAPAAADGTIYFASQSGTAYAVGMASGQEKWHSSATTGPVIAAVAYAGNLLYVASGPDLIAFNTADGSEKWRATRGTGSWTDPAIVNNTVYAAHDDGSLYALNAATGTEIWKASLGSPASLGIAISDSIVYVGTQSNQLFAVDAATGNKLWNQTLDDWPVFPSIVSGVLYVGTSNHRGTEGERNLYALDARAGTELWRFKADNRLFAPPAFADNIIYLQSWSGTVYALTASSATAVPTAPTTQPTAQPTATHASTPVPTVPIPGEGSQTFPETGKTVTGLFLTYWQQHGALPQQGFPISGVIGEISPLDGKPYTVQYFERAVFEYHPEQPDPAYKVLLSQLGTFQYKKKYPTGAPNQQPNTSPNSQLFAETGHRVGGKFLDYWKAHGGLAQQGFPISEEFTEVSDLNGKPYTVQYFERAVFEMHPENPAPYDVLLSQLGTFQYKANYGETP